MINIFYNKKTLNDTMLIKINLDNENVNETKTKQENNLLITYNQNNPTNISIKDVSKKINLPEGYLKINNQINEFIKKETGIDLIKYNDKNFIIGKIIEATPIQNTHLKVCKIDVNQSNILQIVCGAENARNGIKVVVSMLNNVMPNGQIIKKGKLHSFESYGMLCSKKELNIDDQESKKGIYEVEHLNVGDEFLDCFNN